MAIRSSLTEKWVWEILRHNRWYGRLLKYRTYFQQQTKPTTGKLARSTTRLRPTPYFRTTVATVQTSNHVPSDIPDFTSFSMQDPNRRSPSSTMINSQKKRIKNKNAKIKKQTDTSPSSDTRTRSYIKLLSFI